MPGSQDWPLQYLLDALRFAATRPMDDDAAYSALMELAICGLVDVDMDAGHWQLMPAGRALLELLEDAAAQRRYEGGH